MNDSGECRIMYSKNMKVALGGVWEVFKIRRIDDLHFYVLVYLAWIPR